MEEILAEFTILFFSVLLAQLASARVRVGFNSRLNKLSMHCSNFARVFQNFCNKFLIIRESYIKIKLMSVFARSNLLNDGIDSTRYKYIITDIYKDIQRMNGQMYKISRVIVCYRNAFRNVR